ncbi:uncharacterized protein K460DRAFT_59654 [Cucurbitaria berberidis CBS 394.84]|uniref:Transmembrane protein n=1 Tax=Cucurbitaria berberidis CBS 394.84 TaxID=1168544 RepID=A0A9P4LAM5_9PLEO|nr:uncharacterized protein K460DRAFT_59654 [Cucurbitaria berberidis CBS 394.84]KAF1847522.1 hypothetical protein K460DRAFT_59654 [Cucurbitaria berberidis CBS 394.84]
MRFCWRRSPGVGHHKMNKHMTQYDYERQLAFSCCRTLPFCLRSLFSFNRVALCFDIPRFVFLVFLFVYTSFHAVRLAAFHCFVFFSARFYSFHSCMHGLGTKGLKLLLLVGGFYFDFG